MSRFTTFARFTHDGPDAEQYAAWARYLDDHGAQALCAELLRYGYADGVADHGDARPLDGLHGTFRIEYVGPYAVVHNSALGSLSWEWNVDATEAPDFDPATADPVHPWETPEARATVLLAAALDRYAARHPKASESDRRAYLVANHGASPDETAPALAACVLDDRHPFVAFTPEALAAIDAEDRRAIATLAHHGTLAVPVSAYYLAGPDDRYASRLTYHVGSWWRCEGLLPDGSPALSSMPNVDHASCSCDAGCSIDVGLHFGDMVEACEHVGEWIPSDACALAMALATYPAEKLLETFQGYELDDPDHETARIAVDVLGLSFKRDAVHPETLDHGHVAVALTLSRPDGRTMTVPRFQCHMSRHKSPAMDGAAEYLATVLGCVVSDASWYQNSDGDLGHFDYYDDDPAKTLETFAACYREAVALHDFLPEVSYGEPPSPKGLPVGIHLSERTDRPTCRNYGDPEEACASTMETAMEGLTVCAKCARHASGDCAEDCDHRDHRDPEDYA